MLPARARPCAPWRAIARKPPGRCPPRPRRSPASDRRPAPIADAADRTWRRRPGRTSGRLPLRDWRNRAEADLDPVPSVDGDDQQSERHLLLLGELRLERGIDVVGGVRLRYERQG